jgi:hypothetical protein
MLIVEFSDLEIGSAAERYRTSMAKYLPKPLRTLYRSGRARAVNGFTSSNAAVIIEIKRQCHEKSDFGHSGRSGSKISGNQIIRTPASANIDFGSGGTYQIAVEIERVQKTRLIWAGTWLNPRQCVFVYKK